MSPRWRRRAAAALVVGSLIAWPLSAFTLAKDEPQFVLGLSFLAITFTAADIWATTDVRKEQEGSDET